jgi:predicted acetyltransferase
VETKTSSVEVVPATREQDPILANLLELYIHEFSEFHHVDIREDGRFGYPSLSLYWSAPDRHPFFIREDGKLAGFVLVKKETNTAGVAPVWDMAEFFVLRSYRKRGIGTQAAHQVWRCLPGLWQVRVMQANTSALEFWARAIATFAGKVIHPVRFAHGGESWKRFFFESLPAATPAMGDMSASS